MACTALLDNASVPVDIGAPAYAPALRLLAMPSGDKA